MIDDGLTGNVPKKHFTFVLCWERTWDLIYQYDSFFFLHFLLDMFDKTRTGRMDLFGFSALWDYMQRWRALFQQYDRDRSGCISGMELHQGIPVCVGVKDGIIHWEMSHNVCKWNPWLRQLVFNSLLLSLNSSPPYVCPLQLWHRWATTWAPSFLRRWCVASSCEAGHTASSWTVSSRCAPNSRAWRRPSRRETQPCRAMSASTMKNSFLVPSPGSCEPHSNDSPSALRTHKVIPCSCHILFSFQGAPTCGFVYRISASSHYSVACCC